MKDDDNALRPTLELDTAKYEAMLTDMPLSDAERHEFLQAIWQIVVSFVQLGFEVKASDQSCGELAQSSTDPALRSSKMVSCTPKDSALNAKSVSCEVERATL